MVRTPSHMVPLKTPMPDFLLPDVSSSQKISGKTAKAQNGTLVMFICNHCPFVKHIIHGIIELANDYQNQGISFFAISANDVASYPEDAPEKMKIFASEEKFTFPYLYDETQEVAKAFHAACTPDFFLYDENYELVYRGQFDDARPGNNLPVTGRDLRKTLDCLLAKTPIPENQTPSIGCNIKWKIE